MPHRASTPSLGRHGSTHRLRLTRVCLPRLWTGALATRLLRDNKSAGFLEFRMHTLRVSPYAAHASNPRLDRPHTLCLGTPHTARTPDQQAGSQAGLGPATAAHACDASPFGQGGAAAGPRDDPPPRVARAPHLPPAGALSATPPPVQRPSVQPFAHLLGAPLSAAPLSAAPLSATLLSATPLSSALCTPPWCAPQCSAPQSWPVHTSLLRPSVQRPSVQASVHLP